VNQLGVTGPSPGQRRSARAAERRRRARSRRGWISVLVGLGVLVAAAGLAWFTLRPLVAALTEANDYPGPGTGQVSVTVAQGASGTAIGQTLKDAGVIKSVKAFIEASNADSRATGIRPGVYVMKREMTAAGALELLVDPANLVVKRFTVTEGQRLTEILDVVAEGTGIPRADLEAAVKHPADIGLPEQAGGLVEGWLFPATYAVSPDLSAAEVLAQMVRRTVKELTDLDVASAEWNQTIIEASLVEAERGQNEEDAAKIARVLVNRVAANRPLQLDTTVNYALGRRKVAVTEKETKIDSPYNTYLHPGLPVGAICSPGGVAIQAVLHPAEGPWMYFVAVNPDTGQTKFATTEQEFFALQAELNKWLAANPDR